MKVIQAGRSYGRGRPRSDADQPGCCTLVLHCFRGFQLASIAWEVQPVGRIAANTLSKSARPGPAKAHKVRDLGRLSRVMCAERFWT